MALREMAPMQAGSYHAQEGVLAKLESEKPVLDLNILCSLPTEEQKTMMDNHEAQLIEHTNATNNYVSFVCSTCLVILTQNKKKL